jgi:hypothetical protein
LTSSEADDALSTALARLAASEAARAAAEQRTAALSARLEALNLVEAGSSGAAKRSANLVRASLALPSERMRSPTADGARCFIESSYAALLDAPVTLAADAALASDFRRLSLAAAHAA